MPKIKSAKKALRQNRRKREQNIQRKNRLKNAIKKYEKSLKTGKFEAAEKCLAEVYKAADKTAKSKTIKKGKANRIKSRLSQLFFKAKSNKASS